MTHQVNALEKIKPPSTLVSTGKQQDQSFSVSRLSFTRQIFQKKTPQNVHNLENRLGQQFANSNTGRGGVSIYTSASSGRAPIGIFETRLSTRWHVPVAVHIYVHARAREYLINRRRHVNTTTILVASAPPRMHIDLHYRPCKQIVMFAR